MRYEWYQLGLHTFRHMDPKKLHSNAIQSLSQDKYKNCVLLFAKDVWSCMINFGAIYQTTPMDSMLHAFLHFFSCNALHQ